MNDEGLRRRSSGHESGPYPDAVHIAHSRQHAPMSVAHTGARAQEDFSEKAKPASPITSCKGARPGDVEGLT